MYPSATICRTQEAMHLERATSSPLEKVRAVAAKAAKAWGIEAIAAEQREMRSERVRLHRLTHAAGVAASADCLSENPDRGLANA